jgi:hypothetical protein
MKAEHVLIHSQTVGQNHNINIANKSFKNMSKLKYLGMKVTNKNSFM